MLLELSGAATARAEERAKASVVVAFVDRATKGEEGKAWINERINRHATTGKAASK